MKNHLKHAATFLGALAMMTSVSAFAAGDAAKGKALYATRCGICHSLTMNGIGPSHKDLIGRKAGTAAGYAYSEGFAKTKLVWDEKTLDAWIAFPENLVPGQKMGFYVMEADVRADIIAYLASLVPAKPADKKP